MEFAEFLCAMQSMQTFCKKNKFCMDYVTVINAKVKNILVRLLQKYNTKTYNCAYTLIKTLTVALFT